MFYTQWEVLYLPKSGMGRLNETKLEEETKAPERKKAVKPLDYEGLYSWLIKFG